MFNLDDFTPESKRIKADWLKAQPQKAIKGVITGGGVAEFKDGEKVPYITLTSPVGTWEGEKELLLSSATNKAHLKAVYGEHANAWIGKEIGVYFDPTVTYAGQATGGIRVKAFANPFADTQPQTPPVAAAAPATVPAEDLPF